MLGIERANGVQRIMQRVASTRRIAFIFRHTFHHVDRALYRLTGSAHAERLRRRRTEHHVDDDRGAAADNHARCRSWESPSTMAWRSSGRVSGRPHQPGWYHNLLADPHAGHGARRRRPWSSPSPVPDGAEYDAVMRAADAMYSGYPIYRRRITRRRVPVFVLRPRRPLEPTADRSRATTSVIWGSTITNS